MRRKQIGVLDLLSTKQRLAVLKIYHYGMLKTSDVTPPTRKSLVEKKYVQERNGILTLPDSMKNAVQRHLSLIKREREYKPVQLHAQKPAIAGFPDAPVLNVPAPAGNYVC